MSASSATEELSQVVELLALAARELPSTVAKSGRPSCVAWIRARAGEAEGNTHYDWSTDAFAATVHLERRKLRVRSLEFACTDGQAARIADALLQELADEQPFVSARYDSDGRRFVGAPRLQHRASYAPRATSIGPNDVVLVTGGAKGITAQCALALARETRATMVLVGSSRAPDAEAHGPGADEIRETLLKFEAEGLRSEYRQCDLAVREDVERLVAAVRKDFGSVDVLVHGAGLNRPRRVEEPNVSEVIEEIAPKLLGALHLFAALEDVPPKMFVALTSVIGVVGMAHNGWYAFANQVSIEASANSPLGIHRWRWSRSPTAFGTRWAWVPSSAVSSASASSASTPSPSRKASRVSSS
ncbi:MAG: SDR family NAD(P)-dependent oxidoreductase [Myxococcales bacterium]|nr:SDR family NAD(P)-dependent oxidoreductase [Myxococcales bacterium]